jgi:hypothetical protein
MERPEVVSRAETTEATAVWLMTSETWVGLSPAVRQRSPPVA